MHLDASLASRFAALARPAIELRRSRRRSSTRLGGDAQLHPDKEWPANESGELLTLLCVIDLAEAALFETDLDLPASGLVNVFYDVESQPWGFRPSDRHGFRVELADPGNAVSTSARGAASPATGLEMVQTLTLPDWGEPAVQALFPGSPSKLNARGRDRSELRARATGRSVKGELPSKRDLGRRHVSALQDAWAEIVDHGDSPAHQIGGWPRLVQDTIWRECDLVSRGYELGGPAQSAEAQSHASPSPQDEWSLLVQVEADEEMGWMWGDVGVLYFAVKQPLELDTLPENAWCVLQCS